MIESILFNQTNQFFIHCIYKFKNKVIIIARLGNMLMNWDNLSKNVLDGEKVSKENALAILYSPNSELLSLLQASYKTGHNFFSNKVSLHLLGMLKVYVLKTVHFAHNQQKQLTTLNVMICKLLKLFLMVLKQLLIEIQKILSCFKYTLSISQRS